MSYFPTVENGGLPRIPVSNELLLDAGIDLASTIAHRLRVALFHAQAWDQIEQWRTELYGEKTPPLLFDPTPFRPPPRRRFWR